MATLQLIRDFLGKTIGNWLVEERIGEGGYGIVYRARHLTLDERVAAIKLLKPEALHDPTLIERFRNEARAAARIKHPGIVRIDDIGEHAETGAHYIIMEYLRGMDLQRRLAPHREGLPLHEVIDLGAGIASVLDAVHAQRIIHRDIKPENIFLTEDGLIKLLDLGIAKLTPDLVGSFRTSAGMVLGSPGYFAPELADPKRNASIDHRSDVFSFSAVIYELVTHDRPWHFSDPWHYVALIQKADVQRPRDPRVLRPELPVGWSRAIMAGLSKDPDARPESAGALVRALAKDFPRGEAIVARRLDAIGTAGGSPPRRRASTSPAAVELVDDLRSRTPMLETPADGASASAASPVAPVAEGAPATPSTAASIPTLRETLSARSRQGDPAQADPARVATLTPERVPTLVVANLPTAPAPAPAVDPDRVPTLVPSPRVPTGSIPELLGEPEPAAQETGPTRTLAPALLDEARPAPIVASGTVAASAQPIGRVERGAVLLDPVLAAPAPAPAAPIGTPAPMPMLAPTTTPASTTARRRAIVAVVIAATAITVTAMFLRSAARPGSSSSAVPDGSTSRLGPLVDAAPVAMPADAATLLDAPTVVAVATPPDAAFAAPPVLVDAGSMPPDAAPPVDSAPPERRSRSTSRTSSTPRAPGTLIITANPFAEIAIDGRHRGTTPLTVDLPPKRYRVTLTGPAGEVKVFRVTVSSGREKRITHRWTPP